MKRYHLFILKRETVKLYQRNSNILYLLLKNLYELNEKDLIYGISVYHQLCMPINKKLLINYMIDKVPSLKKSPDTFKILSFFENTKVTINYSNILVTTDVDTPEIYKIFNIYNDSIFACDFENNNYFWLNKKVHKK